MIICYKLGLWWSLSYVGCCTWTEFTVHGKGQVVAMSFSILGRVLCTSPCLYLLFYLYLFQDLLNFDDPLNLEAAEHYQRDKVSEVSIACITCMKERLIA